MTRDELRALVIEALVEVAPELEPAEVESAGDLREDLEIDSMDFLNFVIGLHERTGVEIPESDYPKLVTLDALVEYLGERGAASGAR